MYDLEDEIDAFLHYLETQGELDDDRLQSGTSFRNWRLSAKYDYPKTERRRQPYAC
jgi:hypothetical protein